MKPNVSLSVLSALAASVVLTMGVAGAQPQSNPGALPQVQVPRAMALPAPVTVPSKSVQSVAPPAPSITAKSVTLPTSSVTASSVAALDALRLPQGATSTGNAEEARKAGQARLTAALLQIQAGTLSPEETWQKGDLTYTSICNFFEHSTGAWIVGERAKDGGLHHALIALLVAHEGEKLKTLPQVPLAVRVWLADYYQSSNDPKCIEVAESILAQMPRPLDTTDDTSGVLPIAFQAVEREGWFYQGQGQYEKGAEAWIRLSSFGMNVEWMASDAEWQTGRMYLWAHQVDKAATYFAQVNARSDNFYKSMVTYDQASELLREGKSTEARQLTSQTLKVVDAPVDRAIQFMMMGQACYASGDMTGAQSASQSCLDEAAKAKDVNPMIGFGGIVNTAQDLLQWSQFWQKQSLICSLENLIHPIAAPTAKKRLWKTSFSVRSFKPISLNVSSDDPRVKCSVQPVVDDPWFPRHETRFVEQTVNVEVPIESGLSATLSVTSPDFINTKNEVAIRVGS